MQATAVPIGIDLGTTRTIVSVGDRGNYPIVGFRTPDGDFADYYPTTTAAIGGRLLHGHRAEAAARDGAPVLRSWKRLMFGCGSEAEVRIGAVRLPLLDLVTDFLISVRRDLVRDSNLPVRLDGSPAVVVSVPANAHSTQRFTTLEAFRRAGFTVRTMLNEPSAAALEYANRYARTINTRREHVVVYDLGGGTFDVALVRIASGHHDVLDTSGIAQLGGDDFDEVLATMALERAGVSDELSAQVRAELLLECRAVKEGIHPNTKRVVLDLEALGEAAPPQPPVIAVSDYYERLRPLVERTLASLAAVVERAQDEDGSQLAGVYVVGGAAGLPLVPRVLREVYERRVHRSTYPSAATAIGLAIAAEADAERRVTERLTRHLGVFRELERGQQICFDEIFEQGTPMPAAGESPLTVVRHYRAAHNLGHFRFVECSALDADSQPCGDITPHGQVRFPFVDACRAAASLDRVEVERLEQPGPQIEERYEIDAAGVMAVTIADLEAGYQRRYVL